jgi:DUF1680 family protein
MGLEELSPMVYSRRGDGIAINLYTENEATISIDNRNTIHITQSTQYPFSGNIKLQISSSKKLAFPLYIRIPEWAIGAEIKLNGKAVNDDVKAGTYYTLNTYWEKSNIVEINFPIEIKLVEHSEFATAPQGTADIYRINWLALTSGPLVYATNGLINGEDREKTLHLFEKDTKSLFKPAGAIHGVAGQGYHLSVPGIKPLLFLPYYEAGGRTSGAWRLTWIQNKID